MSHQSHDVWQGHYLLRWAEAQQATMQRRAAEAHLARQVRASQPVGLRPVAVLRRVGTQVRVTVRGWVVGTATPPPHDWPAALPSERLRR